MATMPNLNRSRLMAFAWMEARRLSSLDRWTGARRPVAFLSVALKAARANERCVCFHQAKRAAAAVSAASIRFAMDDLENADRLGVAGMARLADLGVQLHAAA